MCAMSLDVVWRFLWVSGIEAKPYATNKLCMRHADAGVYNVHVHPSSAVATAHNHRIWKSPLRNMGHM
jgi:hypothetical protein